VQVDGLREQLAVREEAAQALQQDINAEFGDDPGVLSADPVGSDRPPSGDGAQPPTSPARRIGFDSEDLARSAAGSGAVSDSGSTPRGAEASDMFRKLADSSDVPSSGGRTASADANSIGTGNGRLEQSSGTVQGDFSAGTAAKGEEGISNASAGPGAGQGQGGSAQGSSVPAGESSSGVSGELSSRKGEDDRGVVRASEQSGSSQAQKVDGAPAGDRSTIDPSKSPEEEGEGSRVEEVKKPATFPRVGQVVNWVLNNVLPRPWK
jgi:hypothetical protein